MAQPVWKVVWQLIKKLNTHLPAIPIQENWKHMSTNNLLQKCPIKFIHNNQNQPDIHQQGIWIKTLWYIHTVEYYSATERNKLFFKLFIFNWRILALQYYVSTKHQHESATSLPMSPPTWRNKLLIHTIIYNNKSQNKYAKWRKLDKKGCLPYNFIYARF